MLFETYLLKFWQEIHWGQEESCTGESGLIIWHTGLPNPILAPPSARPAGRQLVLSVRAQCVQRERSSALNGLDSRPRKKHSGTTGEDVLLNQGTGLGKSAGRPFLSCFLPSTSFQQQERRTLFFFHRTKRADDSRTQRKSRSSRLSGCGFLFMLHDNHRAWMWSRRTRPCTDLSL